MHPNYKAIIFVSFILSVSVALARESLSCRNEEGVAVDWFVVYKIPYLHNDPNEKLRSGFAYAYISGPPTDSFQSQNDQQGWTLSRRLISDRDSIFAQTLNPLFIDKNAYSHIIYSDAPSENSFGSGSGSLAHAKGVLALDSNTGFWLIHSVPQFPDSPSHASAYSYPPSGRDNGQSAICISISTNEAKKVISQLLYMRANVYSNFTSSTILQTIPAIQLLLDRNWPKTPTESIININTLSGRSFESFSRSPKSPLKDLYIDMMAPQLKTDLLVETWRRGAGTPLTSNCTYEYKVNNVKSVGLTFNPASAVPRTSSWSYLEDHSKWAIAVNKPLTCIGDINRMASQAKRGGGSLCFTDSNVWKAASNSVHDIESCPRNGDQFNNKPNSKGTEKSGHIPDFDLPGGRFGFIPTSSSTLGRKTSLTSLLPIAPLYIAFILKY